MLRSLPSPCRPGRRGAIALLLAVLVAAASTAFPRGTQEEEAPPSTAPAQEILTPEESRERLLEHMKGIEEQLNKLRRQLRKPEENADSWQRIVQMQRHCVEAKSLPIPMLLTAPEAEREALLSGYRKGMAELLAELTRLEVAVLDSENDKALEIYRVLKDLEAAGHEAFMPDE